MSYTINIERGDQTGTLTFNHGSVSVSTTCWWDLKVKIDAGTYTGYATWMASKQEDDGMPCPWKGNQKYRPAIYLGKNVPVNNRTSDDIFIHKGTSAAWSDGCIVCAANEVKKIWNAISPKDTANVTIIIKDKETAATAPAPAYNSQSHGWSCTYLPKSLTDMFGTWGGL
jgi:hypothetical protein